MNTEEFERRFRDLLPTFQGHLAQWREKPLQFALSSYIRFIEKQYGKRIKIVFTRDLPRHASSVTKEYENNWVLIYLHVNYEHAAFNTDEYHTACGLIAHELGHLMLDHRSCFEKYMFSVAEIHKDLDAADVEAFLALVDFDADMYGAILAIYRAPVFERAYYYEEHPYILGGLHRHSFCSEPFQDTKLGFLHVRSLMEKEKLIFPPHVPLANVLAEMCKDCGANGKQLPQKEHEKRARKMVTKYRAHNGIK